MSKNFSKISLEHTRKTPNQQFMFGNFLLYLGGVGIPKVCDPGVCWGPLRRWLNACEPPRLSMEQYPGRCHGKCLGRERIFENTWAVAKTLVLYCKKGDEILASYIGIIVSQYRDPGTLTNQDDSNQKLGHLQHKGMKYYPVAIRIPEP